MRKTLVYVELPSYDWEPFSRLQGSKAILSRSSIKTQWLQKGYPHSGMKGGGELDSEPTRPADDARQYARA
jgi:hypothetical protein